MEYSQETIENAQRGLKHLYNQVREISNFKFQISKQAQNPNVKFQKKFRETINDDLNMPQALAVAQEVLKSDLANEDKLATLLDFDKVFGLQLATAGTESALPETVQKLVAERETARQNQDWDKADDLRHQIEEAGYTLEDSSGGARLLKK
jgi:cysteinyl-tRNA synthetase